MPAEGIIFYGFFGLIFAGILLHSSKKLRQLTKRQKSLRFDEKTNTYRWIGFGGEQQESQIHPAQPGGEWYETEFSEYSQSHSNFEGSDSGDGVNHHD